MSESEPSDDQIVVHLELELLPEIASGFGAALEAARGRGLLPGAAQ